MEVRTDQNNTYFNKKNCKASSIRQIKKYLPILNWFPKYKWKENIASDIMGGVTLMFVNVPQGLAFSVLANVDLMFGIYTSFLASLLYTFFGTAYISSFGPVAVGSMLIGEAVSKVVSDVYTNNEIAVVITFLIGLWYIIGFILKLGVISMIFRKPFVSGFIAACALHILAKSVKLLLGLKTPNSSGILSFYYNLYTIYENFNQINYPTVIISVVILVLLVLNTYILRPIISKYTKFVIPIEALVMLGSVILSYYLKFEEMGVPVVGKIPTGFPQPNFPEMKIISHVWEASLVIAIINYSTTLSMTMLFNKELRSDQELLAMGIVNLICCNFQCITIGNSMMRTMVVVNLGVKSLMSTMVSSILLVFVMLFGGPLFQPLPTAVLGCIIVASAGQLVMQRFQDVKSIWQSSIENGLIWASSLLAGVFIDLQVGMIAGALLSLRQLMIEVQTKEKLNKRVLVETENLENDKNAVVEPESVCLLVQNGKPEPKIV